MVSVRPEDLSKEEGWGKVRPLAAQYRSGPARALIYASLAPHPPHPLFRENIENGCALTWGGDMMLEEFSEYCC